MEKTYFISGIDTDAGKSVVTGVLARTLAKSGVNVITQKFIQTGCKGISEDILTHRHIMGVEPFPEDVDYTTCPIVMTYPCSPHLAAEIDHVTIDLNRIKHSTSILNARYDTVLLEGAGGLYVPVTRDYNTIDYVIDNQLPLILVVSSKLGSINHALMSLELCRYRNVRLYGVAYNRFPEDSLFITNDSYIVIKDYLCKYFPEAKLAELPVIKGEDYPLLNIFE